MTGALKNQKNIVIMMIKLSFIKILLFIISFLNFVNIKSNKKIIDKKYKNTNLFAIIVILRVGISHSIPSG